LQSGSPTAAKKIPNEDEDSEARSKEILEGNQIAPSIAPQEGLHAGKFAETGCELPIE
jgi:hypothetical protein